MRFLKFLSAGIFVLISFGGVFYLLLVINRKNEDLRARDERIRYDSLIIAGKEGEIARLNSSVSGLRQAYESLQTAFLSLSEKFSSIEAKNDSLNNRLNALSAAVEKMKGEPASGPKAKVAASKRPLRSSDDISQSTQATYRKLSSLEKDEFERAKLNAVNFNIASEELSKSDVPGEKSVGKLKIQFEIPANQYCEKGQKEIYVQIVRPDGTVFNNNSGGFFFSNGKKIPYTTYIPVNYTNHSESISFSFSTGNPLDKGTYKVAVYNSAELIGASYFQVE